MSSGREVFLVSRSEMGMYGMIQDYGGFARRRMTLRSQQRFIFRFK